MFCSHLISPSQLSNGRKPVLKKILFIVLVLILLPPTALHAENGISFSSVFAFLGGITAGFMIHEGGHALAGALTNTEMDWELGDINQPIQYTEYSTNDTDGLIINSAGFAVQAVSAEIILNVDRINKNNNFVRGMMFWNIVNPILYSLDYWFIGKTNQTDGENYTGDLQGIEIYSNKTTANVVAAGITALALFQGYRFVKTQNWAPDWISAESHNLNFIPKQSGGFALTYTIGF